MSILVDETTRTVIQGATGQGGQRFIKRMLDFGSPPVAGVTPGKQGEEVHGVPVFDNVREAVEATGANFSRPKYSRPLCQICSPMVETSTAIASAT